MTDTRPEEAMERVLTDGEVEACWQAWKGDHHVALIRKVEEMVLLKYPLPYSVGGVTEAEARERERAAWNTGVRWLADHNNARDGYVTDRDSATAREAYLNPFPKTPRTVTLSDGKVVHGGTIWNTAHGYPYALAKTPEDAEALADLVRHPFEGR